MISLAPFLLVLASFHFTCANPDIKLVADADMPWKGGYWRHADGTNEIKIKQSAYETPERDKILMHELLHCGLAEDRVNKGYPQPKPMDTHEEMLVHALTDEAMERLR